MTKSDVGRSWLRLGVASCARTFPMAGYAKAAGAVTFLLAITLIPSAAAAQCSQNGNVETCSGNLPGPRNFNTSSGVNDLEINNVTTGPNQASLQGVGSTQSGTGSPGTSEFSCKITDTG